MADPKKRRTKKKQRKVDAVGIVHVKASFNNTIISISDPKGRVVCWNSAGRVGFKGSKKSTPFAAQLAAKKALEAAQNFGIKTLDVRVKGPGAGRESALRTISETPYRVKSIKDTTAIPHNGCRPRKKRRV